MLGHLAVWAASTRHWSLPPTPSGGSQLTAAETTDPGKETLALVKIDPADRCGTQVGKKLDEYLKACGPACS